MSLLSSSPVLLLLQPTTLLSEREDGCHTDTRVHAAEAAEAAESWAKQLAMGQSQRLTPKEKSILVPKEDEAPKAFLGPY